MSEVVNNLKGRAQFVFTSIGVLLTLGGVLFILNRGDSSVENASLFERNTSNCGITAFSLTVKEVARSEHTSTLIIPGVQQRSAPASRWLMCVYTELAMLRGFEFWQPLYSEESPDEVIIGFSHSEEVDVVEGFSSTFAKDEWANADTFGGFCGLPQWM